VHEELESRLKFLLKQAGADVDVTFGQPGIELENYLRSWDGQGDLLGQLTEYIPDTSATRLLLCVPQDHPFMRWCKTKANHADWGCCISEFIAVEYAPSKNRLVTQLHESLHLFGVDECYDEYSLQPKNTCDLTECLMRYGSHSPAACTSVLQQLYDIKVNTALQAALGPEFNH